MQREGSTEYGVVRNPPRSTDALLPETRSAMGERGVHLQTKVSKYQAVDLAPLHTRGVSSLLESNSSAGMACANPARRWMSSLRFLVITEGS